ncbi:Hypothetical protein HVIM_02083 [Roseomonas mucosa]|uniref:Signal transduction histidine kinase n=1 Tax=Roseomonas mucosa TaxID=207340 RepID=A0A1S8D1V3_9PROT|nr:MULTISPECIES: ATP-binding protein [Roseomonas]MBS5901723.1 ATP-binding protein [Acetobacteraceae bacterium]MCG7352130.1 ATP-binding protein [Roseomonas mucosa]MCG7357520.1 ATP-binding protein [Roseomonas mucosa]MDT8289297.1 ATP-binding protein [Roseomonas mucosa]MDT8292417.1 ATP-binding protein [Roseomonas mucosa]
MSLDVSDASLIASLTRMMNHPQRSVGDDALRQFRHHSKNALQRILAQLWHSEDLQATPEGRRLVRDLENRISLSAGISDDLFGFTREPQPLDERLRSLCEKVVGLMADPDQRIALALRIDGACPDHLESVVLCVAHEMVGNAVKHGLHVRLCGQIAVDFARLGKGWQLRVTDDGWGPSPGAADGDGMHLMRSLSEPYGGRIVMSRQDNVTSVTLDLPGADSGSH